MPAVALLLALGADPRARSRNALANTPLHAGLAGRAGLEIADALLAAGAEVNAAAGGGFTPLHLAASRGELTLVTRLLLRGAETSARTAEGRTPVDLARTGGHETTARFLETWWGERARIVARREHRLSPWTTLVEKDVEFAPGRAPDTYHAFGPFDWVAAVAWTREGRIAVVRQYRPAVERYTWELPSGFVDPARIRRARAGGSFGRRLASRRSASPTWAGSGRTSDASSSRSTSFASTRRGRTRTLCRSPGWRWSTSGRP